MPGISHFNIPVDIRKFNYPEAGTAPACNTLVASVNDSKANSEKLNEYFTIQFSATNTHGKIKDI